MKLLLAAVAVFVLGGCAPSESASSSNTPTPTPSAAATPSASATPGAETAVATQRLAPAPDLPIGALCSTQITVTGDGNATPLLCRSGAVNVPAWRFYAEVSASVLGLGLNPTQGQVQGAICDDFKHNHATKTAETSGYKLATAYYGWTFNVDPAQVSCT
jgi:hypothetical protein